MRVGGEDANAIPPADPEAPERVSQPVDSLLELAVAVAPLAVDDGGLVGIQRCRAEQEIVNEQRYFHDGSGMALQTGSVPR